MLADLYNYVQVGEVNGQDTKNNENHAFTMEVIYKNYNTVVYGGNIIRFSLF